MKIGFPALNTWLVCGFDFRRLVFLVWFGMGLGRVLIIFFYSNAVVWERGGGGRVPELCPWRRVTV